MPSMWRKRGDLISPLGGNAVLIMYVWIRYSTFGAYLMQPEVLHKVDDVLFCGLQEPQRFS